MKLYVYGQEKDLSDEQKARLEKTFGGGATYLDKADFTLPIQDP